MPSTDDVSAMGPDAAATTSASGAASAPEPVEVPTFAAASSGSAGAGTAAGGPNAAASDSSATPPPPKPESLIDAIADLMQMAVNYMRQETAGVMRDKVVLPGQQLGMFVAFALAAAGLLFLGIGFISVAVLLVLAHYLGWPGALALIGALLLIGAAVFTYLKVRSIQT